ncbi:MAG: histidine phosphatase family protein [Lachnospiraceae bacterium]|nr:histidine phosphatase family protein [Lachnospiraceae bacterium]
MKLVIIRHGDPDYQIDSLTEKGKREAILLADRVSKMKIDRIYVSPLGRARDTAKACFEKMPNVCSLDTDMTRDPGTYIDSVTGEEKKKIVPVTMDWLREFKPVIRRPDQPENWKICWDWMPDDWTKEDIFYDYEKWTEHPVMAASEVGKEIDYVYTEFEKLLTELGYVRYGRYFKAERPNNDTIVFFCHFGLEVVLLSYLLHIPTMLLWHGFIAAPTSVTTICTEERREGKAYFRVTGFGDISHLYIGNEPPAFSGRFCECFTNTDERH